MGFKGGDGFARVPTGKAVAEILTIPIPSISGPPVIELWSGGLLEAIALIMVAPTIGEVVAEDHSGGAFTSTPSLVISKPTIGQATVESWVLVEDCEDAWDEYVQANVTSTAEKY